ncbi:competence type IV pilus minor pilin ComGD [Staphylococcus intermedius]|nr:competence type IV pilus minor pilin ComGD [Staphylococcus intermedius]PCF64827.1 competence protein ComGD [Staphylococcus intermedius]PCF80437.1 competence protein ComGD [Staphylococcus intermedius]PCF81787.1 competence protein ComGD [Staphylococcus intermedius]PCF88124.1 competence protein ComGD [Staphylococcus intermedius]PCF88838.1 competence protein ComGD [Staphylococcus intermedius]
MAKQLRREGFTLIEMLLVLTIVSVMISLSIAYPQLNLIQNTTDYEIKKLTSEIDYYQAYAIQSPAPVMLLFRPNRNDIKIETINPHRVTTIPLTPLHLKMTSNLHALIFDKDGKANQFGTLHFEHQQRAFSLIFHIEQGRYRISYQ